MPFQIKPVRLYIGDNSISDVSPYISTRSLSPTEGSRELVGFDASNQWELTTFDDVLGNHTHPQSDIIDLVGDLANKSNVGHGHSIADTTGLQTALDGKALSVHSHVIDDTTGLQTALDNKSNISHTHPQRYVATSSRNTSSPSFNNMRFPEAGATFSGFLHMPTAGRVVGLAIQMFSGNYPETCIFAVNKNSHADDSDPAHQLTHTVTGATGTGAYAHVHFKAVMFGTPLECIADDLIYAQIKDGGNASQYRMSIYYELD